MSASKKTSKEDTAEFNYVDSSTYSRVKCEHFTVEGFSRAPIMTFWRVPEYKLGFDLGWQPWEFMGTPRWFLSHTHMDHVLAMLLGAGIIVVLRILAARYRWSLPRIE